jgi:ketosteroid isomerase-like protein
MDGHSREGSKFGWSERFRERSVASVGSIREETGVMTPVPGQELIEQTSQAFDAWLAGDAGPLTAALADDVEWIFPGNSDIGGTKHGRDEVFAHWARFGPALRGAEWKNFLSDGERVVVLYTLDFEHGTCDGADVLTYRHGRIVRFQAHLDTALMERVFGNGEKL